MIKRIHNFLHVHTFTRKRIDLTSNKSFLLSFITCFLFHQF